MTEDELKKKKFKENQMRIAADGPGASNNSGNGDPQSDSPDEGQLSDNSPDGQDSPDTQADSADQQIEVLQPEDPLADIDDDDLCNYIFNQLRNDTNDKEQSGWTNARIYDINAYEGNRQPTNFPWMNACNFAVPLTRALVDTAHANIMGSVFADPEHTTAVQGVGVEDARTAPILEQLLNWQANTELDAYEVWDKAVKLSLKHGTAVLKVTQSFFEKRVTLNSVPVENVFLPVDASGFQANETDHVFEVLPLTYNEIQERKNITDPRTREPIYKDIGELRPGFRVIPGNTGDALTRTRDSITGTKLADRQSRDLYYIVECYLTYYRKPKSMDEKVKPVELIVTVAPNGMKLLRKVVNTTRVRPYVRIIPYPFDDRFFGQSLPEIIQPIQEELDYSHNQNINAADIAIAPPIFYDPAGQFDPELAQIVPGGAYPGKTPETLKRQVNPIFERQEDRYWELAERLTGLTELFQGRTASKTKTLGEARLRNNRTEIRFKTLYQRFEKAWSDMIGLVYFYDKNWMPKDKKIKVVGYNDYKTIEELFPNGMDGKFNFTFRNAPTTELEVKRKETEEMCMELLQSPLVQSDKGNLWRVMKRYAEAKGEKNLETMVTKPQEANILSAEEAIQRIMSGQYDLVPEPGIDARNYMLRLQIFARTDAFKALEPKAKDALSRLFKISQQLAVGQMRARIDAIHIKQGRQDRGGPMAEGDGGGGPGGGQPASGAPQSAPQPARRAA